MDTAPITSARLAASVIAVPPLARNADLTLNEAENTKLIRHIESGGVTTLLYGGNANFYHLPLSEFAGLLEFLAEAAADGTLVIPAAGPSFGAMMDQAAILGETDFPTAMILPHLGMTTFSGVETGIRHFVEAFGKPVVLYIKHEGFIEPGGAKRLCDDGLVSWIKYAIVRDDTGDDPFLRELVNLVNPEMIVSGMGEQPAVTHMRAFGLAGFTSGCVCVNPALSQRMLEALRGNDDALAESIREIFSPLEDLRNAINPVRVLHDAVTAAGIAETGPVLPLLSNLDEGQLLEVRTAAAALRKAAEPVSTQRSGASL